MAGPQQLAHDEAGNLWDVSSGKPVLVRQALPSMQIKPAPPAYPYEGPQAAATLQRTQQEVKQAEATASANTEKANAEAESAKIAAAQAQEQYNINHPQANGTEGMSGPQYLKFLQQTDPGRAAYVQALSEGRVPFPSPQMMRTPAGQALLTQVMRADPTIDATNYTTRAAARKNAATGTLGASDNALVTAIGHAARLSGLVPNVYGSSVQPFNYIMNGLDSAFLNGQQPAYNQNAQLLGDEVAAAYGTNSQGKQNEAGSQFSSSLSSQQKNANILGAIDLMSSKLAANRAQFAYGNGQLGKPDFMLLPPNTREQLEAIPGAKAIEQKYFSGLPSAGWASGNGGGGNGGSGPPPVLGTDYSPMVGGPSAGVAQMDPNSKLGVFKQTTKNVYDPIVAGGLNALIHKGASLDAANAYLQSQGATPLSSQADIAQYNAAVQYAKQPGHSGVNLVNATKTVPTTLGERLASSPAAAFTAGAAAGGTAGLSDVVGRTLAGPMWDANRQALAGVHGPSDVAGNVVGGALGMFGGSQAANALGIGARLGRFGPAVGDIGYGATYGASDNPDNPVQGAITGAATAGLGGAAARTALRTAGRVVAPTGGNLAPIYQANPDFRPTIGQALSASDSRFSRALGMGEQAFESMPAIGGIQTSARQAATDEMQRGAFNQALAPLAPFSDHLGGDFGQLPDGVMKGVPAHSFMQGAFNKAFDTARSGMNFVADPQFANDLGAWQRSPEFMAMSADQQNSVQNAINTALKGRIQQGPTGSLMDGPNYMKAASDLSAVARRWASNPTTAGQAASLRDYVGMMDDAASRNSPQDAANLLNAANDGYAKAVIIENAGRSAGGEPTEFTGKQLLKAVQGSDSSVRDRAFLRGQALMQDYATAANGLSPSLADSGTPQRLMWARAGGAGEAAALGGLAAVGHPSVLAPWAIDTLANLPGIRNAVGAAMAPRAATLPPSLADATNLVGQGLYNRAPYAGMFGAPLLASYYAGQ